MNSNFFIYLLMREVWRLVGGSMELSASIMRVVGEIEISEQLNKINVGRLFVNAVD